jgi:hypothetical protein
MPIGRHDDLSVLGGHLCISRASDPGEIVHAPAPAD